MTKLRQLSTDLNAYSFSFDVDFLQNIKEAYQSNIAPYFASLAPEPVFEGGRRLKGTFVVGEQEYFYTSYDKAPLLWVSNGNQATYDLFKYFFDELNVCEEVKRLIDYDQKIIMYCGFFVIGDRAYDELWHVDYKPGSNAYTLLTPLFHNSHDHGNLLYRDNKSQKKKHIYRAGEALIVGDHFSHATEPFLQTSQTRVLLSLTFGTDKMEHWKNLKQTIEHQSEFFIRPCGHVMGTCECLDKAATEVDIPTEQRQTLTIQQALELGVQHHTAGRLPQAENIYQQILQTHPDQPVALHLLGVIAHQGGKNDVAVDLITRALTAKPDYADAHSNLGLVLMELRRLDEAVMHYNKALDIKPGCAEAHFNLGNALKALGRLDEAVVHCRKAIILKPEFAKARSGLAAMINDGQQT